MTDMVWQKRSRRLRARMDLAWAGDCFVVTSRFGMCEVYLVGQKRSCRSSAIGDVCVDGPGVTGAGFVVAFL